MKKTLLLTMIMLSSSLALGASDIYEAMHKFTMGEKKHKQECFDFKKSTMDEKLDLMKRQHNECYDLKIRGIEKLKAQGFSEQLLKDCLAEKLASCERHMEEWKKLCDNHHMRGNDLYRSAKSMLEEFKQSYHDGSSHYRPGESTFAKSETFLERALEMLQGK